MKHFQTSSFFSIIFSVVGMVIMLTSSTANANSNSNSSNNCAEVIQNHSRWIQTPATEPGKTNAVFFKLAINKIKTPNTYNATSNVNVNGQGQVSFAEGSMRVIDGNNGLQAKANQLFSDRLSALGRYTPPVQPFALYQADYLELMLNSNGTANLTLVSRGNTVVPINQMSCTVNAFGTFITGFIEDGEGAGVISLTLHNGT
ncbi:MAG: hypothetical protein HQK53_03315 [Oligoflexia bacterium]|nr:hypothetical protein [Oligoflexia bacterium]